MAHHASITDSNHAIRGQRPTDVPSTRGDAGQASARRRGFSLAGLLTLLIGIGVPGTTGASDAVAGNEERAAPRSLVSALRSDPEPSVERYLVVLERLKSRLEDFEPGPSNPPLGAILAGRPLELKSDS